MPLAAHCAVALFMNLHAAPHFGQIGKRIAGRRGGRQKQAFHTLIFPVHFVLLA
jgi:hypothetical protein